MFMKIIFIIKFYCIFCITLCIDIYSIYIFTYICMYVIPYIQTLANLYIYVEMKLTT